MILPTMWKMTGTPPMGIRTYSPTRRCAADSSPWLATASPGARYSLPAATRNG
jgi:hypothetical protein